LRTFDLDYQAIAGDLDFEMKHISEYLLDLVKDGKLKPADGNKLKVTFQDSCRMGRHLGIYDPPRELLKSLGAELIEMENTREKSVCCGVSAFATCDDASKKMQINRMIEAKKTEADMLVTSCPKCLIHLNCSVANEIPVERSEVDIPIKDLMQVVGELTGI
jgi:Fe-S oxidoreductase